MAVAEIASLTGSHSVATASEVREPIEPGVGEVALSDYQVKIVACSDINGTPLPELPFSGNGEAKFFKVEFTSITLYEKLSVGGGGNGAFRTLTMKGRDRITKLVVTEGGQDYETLTPAAPAVVLPCCELPLEARLTMEYRGYCGEVVSSGETWRVLKRSGDLCRVTDHPITIDHPHAGAPCCAVM